MKKEEMQLLVSGVRNNAHCTVSNYTYSEMKGFGIIKIDSEQKYGINIYSVQRYLNFLGYRTEVMSSHLIKVFNKEEHPLYKIGDKFKHPKDDLVIEILGIKECIADYSTGLTGLSYEIKDNQHKQSYSVPCWYLEKNNQKFGYVKMRNRRTSK